MITSQVAVYTALWQRGIREVESLVSELVKAIFEHGAFVPETPCDLPEGTRILLAVEPQGLLASPPQVNDPEERAKILLAIVERMKRNPLPRNAPRCSRDVRPRLTQMFSSRLTIRGTRTSRESQPN